MVIGSNESFNTAEFLQQFNDLQQLFIVSQVEVKDKVNDGVSYQYGISILNMLKAKNVKDAGTIQKN